MPEALICDYVRTPIGRYGGALSTVRTDDLAAIPLKALLARHPDLDPEAIEDVILGCANQAGEDNRNVARMALLLAGLPVSVPGVTVNRLCASGLEAVMTAARAIKSGEAELLVAGGVESMSRAPYVLGKAEAAFARGLKLEDSTLGWRFVNPLLEAQYGAEPLGATGENVAAEYGISRLDQDKFGLRSQERAAAAQASGRLAREIVPVEVPQKKADPVTVARDEHPRQTSLEALARLKSPFRPGGSVTAGNAAGINDGAAALLVASEEAAARWGLKPMARVVAGSVAGVPPRIMGMGPEPATRRLCARLGLTPRDFDVIELNEAFASQAIAVLRALGIPEDAEHVNRNGGAIALGHPLGMSGARLAGTAALELNLDAGKRALVSMCIGVGQGIAVALETL